MPCLPSYDYPIREVDSFMYDNEDMLVLYAAGNLGNDAAITANCLMKNGICVGSINGNKEVPGFSGR